MLLSAFRPCTPCNRSKVRQPAVSFPDQDAFPAIPDSSKKYLCYESHADRSGPSPQGLCNSSTNCLIKPGRNKEARHSDDTRKRNTNAQTLPRHYRWHVCSGTSSLVPATRTGSRKLGASMCARMAGLVPLLQNKRTCYMRQLISMVLLVYFEEDWHLFFIRSFRCSFLTPSCAVSRRTPTEAGSECDY